MHPFVALQHLLPQQALSCCRLFSVNALTERQITNLFARNERLVLRLQAPFGEFALVLVGALIVAA